MQAENIKVKKNSKWIKILLMVVLRLSLLAAQIIFLYFVFTFFNSQFPFIGEFLRKIADDPEQSFYVFLGIVFMVFGWVCILYLVFSPFVSNNKEKQSLSNETK